MDRSAAVTIAVITTGVCLSAALGVVGNWIEKPAGLTQGTALLILGVIATASAVLIVVSQKDNSPHESSSPIVGMSGGCKGFRVYAQNRWEPYGTAIREQPNVLSTQVGSFPGNMAISVNGWVHGTVAYPTNRPPFNNDIWYHLSDAAGWVSFGGVRETPTSHDPTGLAEGDAPAPAPAKCQGAVQ